MTRSRPTRFHLARIERDYQELKGDLGLDNFEGRTEQLGEVVRIREEPAVKPVPRCERLGAGKPKATLSRGVVARRRPCGNNANASVTMAAACRAPIARRAAGASGAASPAELAKYCWNPPLLTSDSRPQMALKNTLIP
jgi:hypothetical protein